jgi:hypothetical protein
MSFPFHVTFLLVAQSTNDAYEITRAESHLNSSKRLLKAPPAVSAPGRQLTRQRHRLQQHSSRHPHHQLLLRQSRYTIGLQLFSKLLRSYVFFSFLISSNCRLKISVDLPSKFTSSSSDIVNTDVSERMKRSCGLGLRQNTLDSDFHSTKRLAPAINEQRRASMTMAPRWVVSIC